MNVLLLFIPLSLAFAHYCGIRWRLHSKNVSQMLQSFSGGLAVAYIFLIIIPEIITVSEEHDINGLVLLLLGFGVFHVVLKLIVKYSSEKQEKEYLLEELHVVSAAVYSFLLTFAIIDIIQEDFLQGLVLFGVILLHTIISDISNLGQNEKYSIKLKLEALIGATLLGGVLAIAGVLSPQLTDIIFAFAAGAIIYITIREEVPMDSRGFPAYFIVGMVLVIIVDQILVL